MASTTTPDWRKFDAQNLVVMNYHREALLWREVVYRAQEDFERYPSNLTLDMYNAALDSLRAARDSVKAEQTVSLTLWEQAVRRAGF